METIKVIQEQVDAIKYLMSMKIPWTAERIIEDVLEDGISKDWEGEASSLNGLDLRTVIALCMYPELLEIIDPLELKDRELVNMYNEQLEISQSDYNNVAMQSYSKGYVRGMRFVLDNRGIKVEGIIEDN